MENNKLVWVLIPLLALLFAYSKREVLLDKLADRVIIKMQKEYSPSPYGPGLDPDKFDVTKFRNQ